VQIAGSKNGIFRQLMRRAFVAIMRIVKHMDANANSRPANRSGMGASQR
jgi:hypothetical protein